jgi:hypothetical protein
MPRHSRKWKKAACAASEAVRTDHLEGLVHMYIGLGTLIFILVVVAIIYFVRRA